LQLQNVAAIGVAAEQTGRFSVADQVPIPAAAMGPEAGE
jgi:hypothetical protein